MRFKVGFLVFYSVFFKLYVSDDAHFLGCYNKFDVGVVEESLTSLAMTVGMCKDHCTSFVGDRYDIFGMEQSTSCHCIGTYESFSTMSINPESDFQCSVLCLGGGFQPCGLLFSLAVYFVVKDGATTSSFAMTRHVPLKTTSSYESFTNKAISETPTITIIYNSLSNLTTTSQVLLKGETSTVIQQGTTSPLTNTDEQTTSSSTAESCVCRCANEAGSRFLNDKLFDELLKEMLIDKKLTTAYKITKISVFDNRLSSRALGWIGIVCICVPFLLLLAIDISNCTRCTNKTQQQQQQEFRMRRM